MKKIFEKTNFQKALDQPLFAIRYLRGKIRANFGYRFGNGYSFPPGRVFIALTGRCNLKCQMCPQDRHPSFRQEIVEERDSNTEELRTIIDDIYSFSPMILVSGGELFLHPSWYDFLSHIKKKELFCSIGTNGMFLERHASKLVDIGIDELSVSIDGPERVHDEIRGLPGTYAKATRGIERVMEEKRGMGVIKPLINVIFTITSRNYQYITTVVELMASLKINTLRIGHLNFLRQKDFDDHMNISRKLFGINHDTSWEGYVSEVHDIDASHLANTIEYIRSKRDANMRITLFPDFNKEEIIQYYSEGSFRSRSFKNACLVPWDTAIIGPKGEVILCPNYIIGNLREKSFREIWNNEKARFFRKVILKKKQLPVCSRGCCFFYT